LPGEDDTNYRPSGAIAIAIAIEVAMAMKIAAST
jgi:hypothetical protein